MKTHIKNPSTRFGAALRRARVLSVLVAGLALLPAGRLTAQTFTTLHSFNYSDGATPYAGLITDSAGRTLYGTAHFGGGNSISNFPHGTVFALNTDGTGFTNLHNFEDFSDGGFPQAGLILSGNTLYGTTLYGGGAGSVFALNTDGTGFTNLHSFNYSSDGAFPYSGLILSGNTLYGTASAGGSSGVGTVFAVNTDGTGFTNLHSFAGYPSAGGNYPHAGLILSGNTLYGTAASGGYSTNGGGSSGSGTVFALNTNGTGFTVLHSFPGTYFDYTVQANTNSDGGGPNSLILSGNTLYGTASAGGSGGAGTVFAVNTDGTGFTNLHSFAGTHFDYTLHANTNSDGASPQAGLILSGNTLYGTASVGGSSGVGTVFALNSDGTGFTNLYSFTALSEMGFGGGTNSFQGGTNSDGANPYAGLILSSNTLYGTASAGGSSGDGTVFSLSLPALPPAAQCKNVTVSADVNCSADASIDDGSYSPNAGGTVTLVQSPPGPYPLGDTSVTLTVTENHGLSNSCVATVTVVDTTPPVITCPDSIVTDATSPAGALVNFTPAASDNCSPVSVTSSPASGNLFAIGDTIVSCTATDAASNQAACTFIVHVNGSAEQVNNLIALVQSLGLQTGTANSLSVKLQGAASALPSLGLQSGTANSLSVNLRSAASALPSLGSQTGTANSRMVKLQGAAGALHRRNIQAACGNLGAFLNEVNAQTGKTLTAAQADLLNAEAIRIRAVLGCGESNHENKN